MGASPILSSFTAEAMWPATMRVRPTVYDNIMLSAVKNGMVGVNINYRLAPTAPWPAGAEEIPVLRKVVGSMATHGDNTKQLY